MLAWPSFLRGHGECVAVREHLGSDLSDGLVSVAFLVHLDEVSVLSPASGIEYQRDVVLMSYAVDLAQVAHGYRLAADRVVGDAGEYQRNVLGPTEVISCSSFSMSMLPVERASSRKSRLPEFRTAVPCCTGYAEQSPSA